MRLPLVAAAYLASAGVQTLAEAPEAAAQDAWTPPGERLAYRDESSGIMYEAYLLMHVQLVDLNPVVSDIVCSDAASMAVHFDPAVEAVPSTVPYSQWMSSPANWKAGDIVHGSDGWGCGNHFNRKVLSVGQPEKMEDGTHRVLVETSPAEFGHLFGRVEIRTFASNQTAPEAARRLSQPLPAWESEDVHNHEGHLRLRSKYLSVAEFEGDTELFRCARAAALGELGLEFAAPSACSARKLQTKWEIDWAMKSGIKSRFYHSFEYKPAPRLRLFGFGAGKVTCRDCSINACAWVSLTATLELTGRNPNDVKVTDTASSFMAVVGPDPIIPGDTKYDMELDFSSAAFKGSRALSVGKITETYTDVVGPVSGTTTYSVDAKIHFDLNVPRSYQTIGMEVPAGTWSGNVMSTDKGKGKHTMGYYDINPINFIEKADFIQEIAPGTATVDISIRTSFVLNLLGSVTLERTNIVGQRYVTTTPKSNTDSCYGQVKPIPITPVLKKYFPMLKEHEQAITITKSRYSRDTIKFSASRNAAAGFTVSAPTNFEKTIDSPLPDGTLCRRNFDGDRLTGGQDSGMRSTGGFWRRLDLEDEEAGADAVAEAIAAE